MIQIGNSNRFIDQLYYYLWYKDDCIKDGIYNVWIPDTIIYQYGRPQLWYFTSKKGEILMKKEDKRTSEHIIECFTKEAYDGKVVAYFIYPEKYNSNKQFHTQEYVMEKAHKRMIKNVDFNERICIFYMTQEMLMKFLQDDSKPPEGILQKFIEPYGDHESLIQAVWSPSVCLLSKQQNYRILADKRYDPFERCATFDGAEVFSRAVPIRGKEISQTIRDQVRKIVEKITNVSYEKVNISRLVLFFKADKNNQIWFLYASSLRTIDEDPKIVLEYRQQHLKFKNNPMKYHHNTPVPLATNYAEPFNIRRQQTTNTIHPEKLLKDIICYDCGQLCQQKDLSTIKYSQIIDTFERDPDLNPILNKEIEIISQDLNSRPPLVSRVFIEQKEKTFDLKPQPKAYLRDMHSHIPPLVLKIYPNITVEVYEGLRTNNKFLSKTIKLCQDCWLLYSQVQCSVSGAPVVIKQSRAQSAQSAKYIKKPSVFMNPQLKTIITKMNRGLTEAKRNLKISTQPTAITGVPDIDLENLDYVTLSRTNMKSSHLSASGGSTSKIILPNGGESTTEQSRNTSLPSTKIGTLSSYKSQSQRLLFKKKSTSQIKEFIQDESQEQSKKLKKVHGFTNIHMTDRDQKMIKMHSDFQDESRMESLN